MGLGIRKGDEVTVLSGSYKGARGKVLEVFPDKGKALVEGVRMVKKHQRQRGQDKPHGIVEQEAAIPLCKLMLVDPKTGTPSRFSNEIDDKGNKIRRSKATGNEI